MGGNNLNQLPASQDAPLTIANGMQTGYPTSMGIANCVQPSHHNTGAEWYQNPDPTQVQSAILPQGVPFFTNNQVLAHPSNLYHGASTAAPTSYIDPGNTAEWSLQSDSLYKVSRPAHQSFDHLGTCNANFLEPLGISNGPPLSGPQEYGTTLMTTSNHSEHAVDLPKSVYPATAPPSHSTQVVNNSSMGSTAPRMSRGAAPPCKTPVVSHTGLTSGTSHGGKKTEVPPSHATGMCFHPFCLL
jgi:hypothetical protein